LALKKTREIKEGQLDDPKKLAKNKRKIKEKNLVK
jgi:hypothetical protein